MKTYRVRWEIDVEADSPADAAGQASEIQRDPESTATVFMVDGLHVDLRRRCNLCGDLFTVPELREHLRAHSPAADSAIGARDVERFFTPIG